jgi:hypothetical protein
VETPQENIFSALLALSKENVRPFFLVGGNAVNAHGYLRTTFDIDVAVSDVDAPFWSKSLEAMGYQMFFATDAFQRFRGTGTSGLFPLDLMLLAVDTFQKMHNAAVLRKVGGLQLPVASPLHLAAMKFHALRQPQRAADGKDLQDIIGLIRGGFIDVQSPDFQVILNKYADDSTKSEFGRRLGAASRS